MKDDTDGAVIGIPREQQLEDTNALFSKLSNFESVVLDQLQSVTTEISELRKQIEELKVTVTALQQLSLVSLPNVPMQF